jgi:glycosyltransferase involved in cell wall biosynthesis
MEVALRIERPDIYHATYYADLGRRTKARRIVEVYDMIHERFPELFPGDDTPALKKQVVAGADRIIAISHATKADVVELLGVSPDKIDVVHLANSLTHVVTEPSAVPAPYVLYVASRQAYKGYPTLLAAYAASKRVRESLRLVCFGTKPFSAAEREDFDRLGIGDRVDYHAGDDAMLARLYQHATMFVYPSLYEGFGLSPLEAMHYGCPVIASRSSSIPEVVRDGGMYFTPGNVEELRAAMEQLLDDSALRSDLIARGRANEQAFSWDRCYEQTLATYRA